MPLNEQQQQKTMSGWTELWRCPRELGSPGKEGIFVIKTAMLILTKMNLREEYFCFFRAKEQKTLSRINHVSIPSRLCSFCCQSLVYGFYSWMMFVHVCAQSVVSNSLQPHGLQPARLLGPWNFPGKSTGAGYYFFLQGIFLTQELNVSLLHWQTDSIPQSLLGSISWVKIMKCILTICPTQYQVIEKAKKKKKSPPLSPYSHTLKFIEYRFCIWKWSLSVTKQPSRWIFLFWHLFCSTFKGGVGLNSSQGPFQPWSPLSPHRRWAQGLFNGELWQSTEGLATPSGSATWTLSQGHHWYLCDNPLAKSRLSRWAMLVPRRQSWG